MKRRTALFKRALAAAACTFVLLAAAGAEYNTLGVPDSTQVRRAIMDTWLRASLGALRGNAEEVLENESGQRFQVRMEEDYDSFVIVVSPETYRPMTYINDSGATVVQEPVYNRDSCGSWLLYRNKADGKASRVVIYFNNNPDVFVQFRPQGGKTYVDLLVYGFYMVRSVPVGMPFENVYRASYQDLYNQTGWLVPWEQVMVAPGRYEDVARMVAVIRQRLPAMKFAKYAAYNEDGELYSIRTGKPYVEEAEADAFARYAWDASSAPAGAEEDGEGLTLGAPGFAKWIVDGIVTPVTGRGTNIADLVRPTVGFDPVGKKGVKSQTWNLTLTLDWVRNLAARALSVRSQRNNFNYDTGGVDVTSRPFVAVVQPDGRIEGVNGYVKDVGYTVGAVKSLLYTLAITNPSWFYLGAVRHSSADSPDESVFDTCAAFFPYFDNAGRFKCTVFEAGKEMALDDFVRQNPGTYVHLERVRATELFEPL